MGNCYPTLISKFPDINGRDTKEGVKLSAGQLIEKTGWKGKHLDNVGVSDKHALVLVSYKGAKSINMIKLVKFIQKSVNNKFKIKLEPEVKIIK